MKLSQLLRYFVFLLSIQLFSSCEDEQDPIPVETNGLVAQAGADKAVKVNTLVELDGSASHDKNKKTFTFKWSIKTKPESSESILLLDQSAKPSFSPDRVGTYVIVLTISQGEFSSTDEVTIRASEDTPDEPETVTISESIVNDITLENIVANPDEADYIVSSDLLVFANVTIEPGVKILFERNTGLTIVQGSLHAVGTEQQPIIMTGKEDAASFWRGLSFQTNSPSNKLIHVTIDGAGSVADSQSGKAANITLAGSDISGASLSIENTFIYRSGGHGIYAFGESTFTTFANNTFADNSKAPIYVPASLLSKLDIDSDYGTTNGTNAIETCGTFNAVNDVVKKLGVSYKVVDDISIKGGVSVEPGTTFTMGQNLSITVEVYGHLHAEGTVENRIVFTSTSPNVYWKGILFTSSSDQNILRYADISNAGTGKFNDMQHEGNIAVAYQGKLSISNSRITKGKGYGIVTRLKEKVNQNVAAANEFSDLTKGWVFPTLLRYPDHPPLHGEWVDYQTYNQGYASIDENYYDKESGVWFGGAASPWAMTSNKGIGLKLTEDGKFLWTIAEPSAIFGCESWSAEYITGQYSSTDQTILLSQDYWRSKFINACDPSQNIDTDLSPFQLTLSYEYIKIENAGTGEVSWRLKFTNPDNSTFTLYRKP